MNTIGFEYTENIFNNSIYVNKIVTGLELLDYKPNNIQHADYRTWQINQPFINNNDSYKLDLSEIQKNILLTDKHIQMVYPELSM